MKCPNCQHGLRDSALFCDNCGQSISPSGQAPDGADAPRTGQPATDHDDQLIGRLVDSKYKILSKLGEGGMGAVYRALRTLIGDEVALKVLLPKYTSDAMMLERFRREARAAAMLHHPNAVTILDYGEASGEDSFAYIVMELLDGETLRELLRREGRLAPARALRLLFGICAGVGSAHRRNIFHRDLKPDNIMILPSREEWETETVKVVDFGIAKLRDLSGESTLTQFGSVLGTPHYMSPEQCRGDKLDARSDVYSLGVILYEMLAGRPPFIAPSAAGVIAKHITEPPPPLPSHLNTPPALAETLSQALSKDPDGRQPDAVVLARELQAKFRWLHSSGDPNAPFNLQPQPAAPAPPAPVVSPPEDKRETTVVHSPAPAQGLLANVEAGPKAPVAGIAPSPAPPRRRTLRPGLFIVIMIGALACVAAAVAIAAGIVGALMNSDSNSRNNNSPAITIANIPPTPRPTPTPAPTPYSRLFSESTAITTKANAASATPYPSNITVTNLSGRVTKVTATLKDYSHDDPLDFDVLLVGPGGEKVMLMFDAGGTTDIPSNKPVTLTFSDSASSSLPSDKTFTSGTYKPTNYNHDTDTDSFPLLSSSDLFSLTLSAFNGTNPNGTWKLYVRDDVADGNYGRIAGGWSLSITVDPSKPATGAVTNANIL